MTQRNVKAVHDDDLERLLDNLGIRHDLIAGKLNCFFCGETVAESDLGTLFSNQGAIAVTCLRAECVMSLHRHLRED